MLALPNTFQFYPDSFLPFGVKRGIPSNNMPCGALMDIGFSQQKPWCSYGRIIKFAYVIARHWPGTSMGRGHAPRVRARRLPARLGPHPPEARAARHPAPRCLPRRAPSCLGRGTVTRSTWSSWRCTVS